MPKTLKNALTATRIATLTRAGRYADGNGLAIQVDPQGNKSWVVRLRMNGRETMRGLGSYPAVSLKEARKLAFVWKETAEKTRVVERTQAAAERATERMPSLGAPTFRAAAIRTIEARKGSWENEKVAVSWNTCLRNYAYPVIGEKPVDEVKTADVMAILEPIWLSKGETASRVKSYIEAVLDWATAHEYRAGDNPAGKHILRALPKRPKAQHMAALRFTEVPAALELVQGSTSQRLTQLAICLVVLTASRSGEVRNAKWEEIDWENNTWTVPAERMKMRREHRVPLSRQAMAVLREAWTLSGPSGLMFVGPRSGKALSDMTFTQLLRRLKIPAVMHGFRSSFRDWAQELSGASWAACESALAHQVGNGVEQAYMRSDLFDQRVTLMQAWADYCLPDG